MEFVKEFFTGVKIFFLGNQSVAYAWRDNVGVRAVG